MLVDKREPPLSAQNWQKVLPGRECATGRHEHEKYNAPDEDCISNHRIISRLHIFVIKSFKFIFQTDIGNIIQGIARYLKSDEEYLGGNTN